MNVSKMCVIVNMGDHVWLITSKHTEPDCSSMFGWKIFVSNPIDGDLYGYCSGSSTCTFQRPPSYGVSRGPSRHTHSSFKLSSMSDALKSLLMRSFITSSSILRFDELHNPCQYSVGGDWWRFVSAPAASRFMHVPHLQYVFCVLLLSPVHSRVLCRARLLLPPPSLTAAFLPASSFLPSAFCHSPPAVISASGEDRGHVSTVCVEGSQDGVFVDGGRRGGGREGSVKVKKKRVQRVLGVGGLVRGIGLVGGGLLELADLRLETLLPATQVRGLVGDELASVVPDNLLEPKHRAEAVVDGDGPDALEQRLVEKRVAGGEVRAQGDALEAVVLRDTLDRGVVDDRHGRCGVAGGVVWARGCTGTAEQEKQTAATRFPDVVNRENDEKIVFRHQPSNTRSRLMPPGRDAVCKRNRHEPPPACCSSRRHDCGAARPDLPQLHVRHHRRQSHPGRSHRHRRPVEPARHQRGRDLRQPPQRAWPSVHPQKHHRQSADDRTGVQLHFC